MRVILSKGDIIMANIWYAREGQNPTTGRPRCELSFEKYQQLFKNCKMNFLGTHTPKLPSSNQNLNDYREPKFVVLELAVDDLLNYKPKQIGFHTQLKEGFYEIDISVNQCEKILEAGGF